jgi:hypothetical protein
MVFTMSTPKRVKIHDSILGLVEKVLMGLILFYLAREMFTNKEYNYVEEPRGYPLFFFERGNFNDIRNDAFNEAQGKKWPRGDYTCTSLESDSYGPYEYLAIKKNAQGDVLSPVNTGNGYKKASGVDGDSVFNDNKVRCKQLNFAEIYKKAEDAGYVATYQKETYSRVMNCVDPSLGIIGKDWDCDHANVRQAPSSVSTVIPKYDNELHFIQQQDSKHRNCVCLELRNYMAIAPEQIAISFFHNYRTSSKVGMEGSTTNYKEDGNQHPDTFLKRKGGGWVDVAQLKDGVVAFTSDKSKSLLPTGEKINMVVKSLLVII